MHIHILGICGTFMGSLAVLARELGYQVSGSDANVYPPMSTQLEALGIELKEGFEPAHLMPRPDLVVVGNAMTRGNPAVEYMLEEGLSYMSGPQWLAQFAIHDKWVLGVAGTHGKTTTSAILTWILEDAGMKPGYLIGGVTNNFEYSARMGDSAFFVVEADEYDSAFFDKRSKFIHYTPRTVILNNLEFDHADIFDSLADIEKQFHHLVRTIPRNGLIVYPHDDSAIEVMLKSGCWTPRQQFGINIPEEVCMKLARNGGVFSNASPEDDFGGRFELEKYGQGAKGRIINRVHVRWEQSGIHNVRNAMAAVAAAHHVGVDVKTAAEALASFAGVKRRMEKRGEAHGITVYDDFAHHPTAIRTTLDGILGRLAAARGDSRVLLVIEPRSNTMKSGIHQQALIEATQGADMVVWKQPGDCGLDFNEMVASSESPAYSFKETDQIVTFLEESCRAGDHIVVMSNGGFDGIHDKLLSAFAQGAAG